jgi:Ni/Fe-hydrogenase subunit HybB-like protein
MTAAATSGRRWTFWTVVSWLLIAALVVAAVLRFSRGLGAVTNLSDRFPWGLWVGFDVLCGVGLASGGFVVTATVYLLNLHRYRPIVRPALLTAFLGYLMVIVALAFDLGRPWNIWHPLIMWNPRSVMFEIGWCVMLYSLVLLLEFAPLVLERLGRDRRAESRLIRAARQLSKLSPVLVVLGVILSTLHQSSLGSLYLIVPGKMHALWYSPTLPLQFFLSAVAAGLSMTVVESWYSRRVFGQPLEVRLLGNLSRVSVLILLIFLVLRLRDLVGRGALPQLWPLSLHGGLFLLENLAGVALPLVLLALASTRRSAGRMTLAHGLVVLGFILHRLNVSITSLEAATGTRYFPAALELVITVGMVTLMIKIFNWACQHLPIFPPEGGARAGSG